MKNLTIMGALALLISPANAQTIGCKEESIVSTIKGLVTTNPCYEVPEMSAGAGVAAIALLVGVAAIIRERSKRK